MKTVKAALALFIGVIFAGLFFISCNNTAEPENQIGERLVKQLWENLLKSDTVASAKFMATGFQTVHKDGGINKEQELKVISGLNIHSYAISDLKVTRNGNVLVTTYKVSVEETVEGERLSKKPAPRMSIFIEEGGQWLWQAHANLKSFEEIVQDSVVAVQDTIN